MSDSDQDHTRLSDQILSALQLSIKQEDAHIAETLSHALDLAMTRNSGGGEFVERRDYPEEVENAMVALDALKARVRS